MATSSAATKYIFVTGGVLSGLGKGITAASIGNILKSRGLKVTMQKCDPYLNVDAGTLNPAEHGECFVTKDGAETDLDLGHYERFLDEEMTQESSLMSGRVLLQLIQEERAGKFLGKTVQVIPHLTNSIQKHIKKAGRGSDVHIVEIGGTVGDYESPAFIEAIRELGMRVGRENCIFVHLVYLPYLGASKEFKTKPAQNAVRDLRSTGIIPDMLVARSEHQPPSAIVRKLSAFCGVEEDAIALLPNARTVYEVPLTLESYGWGEYITNRLKLPSAKPDFRAWKTMVRHAKDTSNHKVTVGLVAKYLDNEDTYMSVIEALKSACWARNLQLEYKWIDAELLDKKSARKHLTGIDGIVVPGGFGTRGLDGMIAAAEYALTHKLPYLGLCLGMQMAVVAQARILGLDGAHSAEVDSNAPHPIFVTMQGQDEKLGTGGTMRLGEYDCAIVPDTLAHKLYASAMVKERHRHRYEFNNKYRAELESGGMIFSGLNPQSGLVEIAEHKNHPFFMGTQYHPEYKSRPVRPHPLFGGFIDSLKK